MDTTYNAKPDDAQTRLEYLFGEVTRAQWRASTSHMVAGLWRQHAHAPEGAAAADALHVCAIRHTKRLRARVSEAKSRSHCRDLCRCSDAQQRADLSSGHTSQESGLYKRISDVSVCLLQAHGAVRMRAGCYITNAYCYLFGHKLKPVTGANNAISEIRDPVLQLPLKAPMCRCPPHIKPLRMTY